MNRFRALVALVFLGFLRGPALADTSVGNGGNGRPPASYVTMTTGTVVVKAQAGIFLGISNLNSAAQINAITCYDNASAASGPVIYNAAVGLTTQAYPPDGVFFVNGLTCAASLTLSGNGVAIYFR